MSAAASWAARVAVRAALHLAARLLLLGADAAQLHIRS